MNVLDNELHRLVELILKKIIDNKISVYDLSDKLYLDIEELMELLEHPVKNFSIYYEIMDTIEKNWRC